MADADPSAGWTLDPTLERDTTPAGDLPLCRVLMMEDATWPWLILVPRRAGASEIVDLAGPDRVRLVDEIALASQALKAITGCDKLNVAALGNAVAQLHVHVIARFRTDPAWPKPVWGAVPARPYEAGARRRFLGDLRRRLPLA